MLETRVARGAFLADGDGKTFADLVNDLEQSCDVVLEFSR
jgi:hypothetical protein